MADDDRLQDRIDALEERVAHQDATIDALNETVTAQWAAIDALKRELGRLGERLDESAEGDEPVDRPPPHY